MLSIRRVASPHTQEDAVLQIRVDEEQRTTVHMRSRSRSGSSDYGSNARRIMLFLRQFDLTLRGK